MRVLILEACRSPEVNKGLTESLVSSKLFSNNDIEYELYSNDGIWTNRIHIDRALIHSRLKESPIDIVHFAVHGGAQGLVLKWSDADPYWQSDSTRSSHWLRDPVDKRIAGKIDCQRSLYFCSVCQ